jgi:hypothetical protein
VLADSLSERESQPAPHATAPNSLTDLQAALNVGDRLRAPENRKSLIEEFTAAGASLTYDEFVACNRAVIT